MKCYIITLELDRTEFVRGYLLHIKQPLRAHLVCFDKFNIHIFLNGDNCPLKWRQIFVSYTFKINLGMECRCLLMIVKIKLQSKFCSTSVSKAIGRV